MNTPSGNSIFFSTCNASTHCFPLSSYVTGVKLAEFERGLIIERTNAGLQSAKDRGQTFGRPVKVTPEKVDEAKRLILVEGLSIPQAAKRIDLSAASLYAAIPGGKGALLGEGLPTDDITYPG